MFFLVLIVAVGLVCVGYRQVKKSRNMISSFHILWWAFFVLLSVLLYDTSKWSFTGIAYIEILAVLAFLGGEIGLRADFPIWGKKTGVAEQKQIGNMAWIMLCSICIIALLGQFISLRNYGFSLSTFGNLQAFMNMNTTIAYERYNGASNAGGGLEQLFLMFSYIAPLCGGMCFVYAKGIVQYGISVFSLLPIVFGMMFTNTKAGFIASIMLFFCGFFVSYLEKYQRFIEIKFKVVLFVLVGAGMLFLVLFTVMCIRVGDFSSETIQIIRHKFAEYTVGQMEAFDLWFDREMQLGASLEGGANTFMAIADKIGVKTRVQGVYGLIEGASSNIFTAIRGTIADFGLIGSAFFYLILGIFAGYGEKVLKQSSQPVIKALTASTLFYFLYSFIISPWIYTSYIVPFVAFGLFSYFSNWDFYELQTRGRRKYAAKNQK